jgi:sugar diacid utilization regulator
MNITLNITLDILKHYNTELHIDSVSSPSFTKCLPLTEDINIQDSSCLYFSLLSQALTIKSSKNHLPFYCVCCRDRISDASETEDMLAGLIIVNENISPSKLMLQLQSRFFELLQWEQAMMQTVVKGGSIQELVDLAEPVLDNFIAVTDSSFIRMAYTRNIDCDCPICADLVRLGYHSETTLAKFRENDLLSFWEKQTSIFTDYSCKVAKYTAHHKIFKFGDAYFTHVVMTCNRHPLTPALIDLFQVFMDVLTIYVEREWNARGSYIHLYDTFLADLIQGSIHNRSQIQERAQYVGIPYNGNFCLFKLLPVDSVNVSLGKMLSEFAELFPKLKFIQYQRELVALLQFSSEDKDTQFIELGGRLEPFLNKHNALCGFSADFKFIDDLTHAFRQATLAITYGESLRARETVRNLLHANKPKSRIYFFNRIIIYSILGEGNDNVKLWRHTKYYTILKTLYEYDQTHKSSTLYMLYVYLITERSATETSAALNMHRNNVIYHINRIQEMLNIDLSRHEVRQLILLSYSMLELYGFEDGSD